MTCKSTADIIVVTPEGFRVVVIFVVEGYGMRNERKSLTRLAERVIIASFIRRLLTRRSIGGIRIVEVARIKASLGFRLPYPIALLLLGIRSTQAVFMLVESSLRKEYLRQG